jgi:hypothetical protein
MVVVSRLCGDPPPGLGLLPGEVDPVSEYASVLTLDDLKAKGWDLKPCPFCGSAEELQVVDDRVRWPQVQCRCCKATVARNTVWLCVVAWNTRLGDKG